MITVIVGQPGAGKSYSATVMIAEALVDGRRVVTNLPIKMAAMAAFVLDVRRRRLIARRRRQRSRADKRRLLQILLKRGGLPEFAIPVRDTLLNLRVVESDAFHRPATWREAMTWGVEDAADRGAGRGVVLVVDEAGTAIDNIIKGKPAMRGQPVTRRISVQDSELVDTGDDFPAWLQIMREHRHYAASVALLCQSHHQLTTDVKALVQEWVELANLRRQTGISTYERVTYDSHYGMREPLHTKHGLYKQFIFDLYSSHDLMREHEDAGGIGIEEEVTAGGVSRWRVYFAGALVVVGIGCFLWFGWTLLGLSERLIDNKDAPVIAGASAVDGDAAAGDDIDAPLSPAADPVMVELHREYPGLTFRRVKFASDERRVYMDGNRLRQIGEGCVAVTASPTDYFLGCGG